MAVHLAGSGVHGYLLGLVAAGPVVAVGAVLALVVRYDPRRVMLATGVVLVGARVAVQVAGATPAAVAAGLGVVAALALLGLLAVMGLPLFGGGVLAGVLLDAALHAALGTRSLIWIDAWWAAPAAMAVGAWYLSLVWSRTRREVFVLGRSTVAALPLIAFGWVAAMVL